MLDGRGINTEDFSLDGDGKLEYVTMCVSPVFMEFLTVSMDACVSFAISDI